MLSTKLTSEEKQKNLDEDNIYNCPICKTSLVKSAAIYGANASGKSNIIKALHFMQNFVINSSRTGQNLDSIPVEPFLLDLDSFDKPSGCEVTMLINGVKYRYGFEVDRRVVQSEWLYYVPKNREFKLFIRNNDGFSISERFKKEAKDLESITRENALFISVVSQFNGNISGSIIKWFNKITFINYRHNPSFAEPLKPMLKDEKIIETFSEIFKMFDIGISKLKIEENQVIDRPEFSNLPDSIKEIVRKNSMLSNYSTKTTHGVYDGEGNEVSTVDFDLDIHESDGTKKLYSILPPLMLAIGTGGVVVIDELDSRLHPLITESLIKIFHSADGRNKSVAQLIFTTHDTNLLRKENFRRDQIWFVEKDQKGSSTLYSLSEIQSRNDANYERDYLKGRYGAIPFINTSIIQNHFGH